MKLAKLFIWMVAISVASAQDGTFFSIRQHVGYPQPEKRLEQLVRAKGSKGENHFCVVGYHDSSGDEYAWAHWKEGDAMVLWEPAADPKHPVSLSTSRRFLRLDRDVVASEAELKGSTYLVTRQWVKRIIRDCEKHGDKFVVLNQRKR